MGGNSRTPARFVARGARRYEMTDSGNLPPLPRILGGVIVDPRHSPRTCPKAPTADSFAAGLVRCLPRLRRYAERGGAGSQADDLVQDTLLRALERRATFDAGRPVWPWLRRICDHAAARRAEVEARGPQALAHPATDRAAELPSAESREQAEAWLSRLRAPEREVLERYYLRGLSVREISQAEGVPEGTTKARLSRARRRLAFFLAASSAALLSAFVGLRSLRAPGATASAGARLHGATLVIRQEVRPAPALKRKDYTQPGTSVWTTPTWTVTGARSVSPPAPTGPLPVGSFPPALLYR